MSDNERYDAIIIGAGVIGGATAFELAKKGWKTLNVDKLPASGYGSTSNSCAIVRAHYSTFDGVAMAYEGFSYWKDWSNYLDSEDERGHALYMQCGTVLFMLEGGHHERSCRCSTRWACPTRYWTMISSGSATRSTSTAPTANLAVPKTIASGPSRRES